MAFFPLTTLQEMVLAFFLGLGGLFLLYLAWGGYPKRPEEGEKGQPPSPFEPENSQRKTRNPVPAFLILVYVLVILWALAYYLFIGLGLKAIG